MENIIKNAEKAERLAASFVKRILDLEKLVSEREAQALGHAAKYGQIRGEQDPGVRKVVKQATRLQAQREARQYRRELVAGSDKERTERLQQLAELEAEASRLTPLYQSPVQLLSRMGLGSPERSRYQDQLREAGARELQNYADWARYTNDRILGAAVLSRLDALPAKNRLFKAMEFAASLVGEEFEQAKRSITRTRVAMQRAVNANRDFERGQVDATAKISMGLARRAL